MSWKEKLNPWNWFQHEEQNKSSQIPVRQNTPQAPAQYQSGNPLVNLHQQIDQIFDHAFKGFGFPSLLSDTNLLGEGAFRPNLDVSSDDKSYHITLDLPGLTDSEVNVEVKGDKLYVQGQKKTENESKDRHFYRVERSYGAFQRVLALPEDASSGDIQASMKDGVLKLDIPRQKALETEVKKIQIN